MITCSFENGNQASLRHVTVGCLVIKDHQILLVKRDKRLLEGGKWCLPGGYADRNESTIETGVRETMEESGWVIGNLRLLCVNDNPDRPHEDRQNIEFVYVADAKEKTGEGDWESEEVRWFPLNALPPDDHIAFDHLDDINLYKKYVSAAFPIPVVGKIR